MTVDVGHARQVFQSGTRCAVFVQNGDFEVGHSRTSVHSGRTMRSSGAGARFPYSSRSNARRLGQWLAVGLLASVSLLACGDSGDEGADIVTRFEPLSVAPGEPVDVGGVTVSLDGFVLTTGSNLEAGLATFVHEETGLDGELVVESGGVVDLLSAMVDPYELPGGSLAQPVRVPVLAGNTYIGQYLSPGGSVLLGVGRADAGRFMVLTLYNVEAISESEGEVLGRDAGTAVSTATFPAAE